MSLLTELDPDVAYPATPNVPDSGLHIQARLSAYTALRYHYADRGDCFVSGDFNVYYRRGDPKAVLAPDVFVCYGVDAAALEVAVSYRVWEAGAAPAFALEIASERTYRADLEVKPAKYLELGVEEYWRFDPTGGDFLTPTLQGERRTGDAWAPIPTTPDGSGRLNAHSRTLNLNLHAETHHLRFSHPTTGTQLPDHDETCRANNDLRRANNDLRRERDAEAAARRAEAAARRAAEAELAELRSRLGNQT